MAGYDAFGTQFKRDSDGMGTFVAIANITDISGPSREREAIEVTAHDSPDQYREFVKGLKDGGEVEIDINYDPREHDALIADFADAVPRSYKVVWPGTLGNWAFKAILTNFEPEAPHDDKLAASLTFKVSGKPTITTGS